MSRYVYGHRALKLLLQVGGEINNPILPLADKTRRYVSWQKKL